MAAANEQGGRDNITVVLLRLEDVQAGSSPPAGRSSTAGGGAAAVGAGEDTITGIPAVTAPVTPRRPRRPSPDGAPKARRRTRLRRAGALAVLLVVLGLLGSATYLASQSVYFIGTNSRGLVTLFRCFPFRLPGNVALYSSHYVSGVSASTLTPRRRRTLLDHSLRSEGDAAALIRSLELGQLE